MNPRREPELEGVEIRFEPKLEGVETVDLFSDWNRSGWSAGGNILMGVLNASHFLRWVIACSLFLW